MCSEASPKNSLAYHRITPISPSYQGDYKGRTVTTSAIVSHEMDGSKSRRGSRLIYNGSSAILPSTIAGSATSKSSSTASREDWRSVKWKDREQSSVEQPLAPASMVVGASASSNSNNGIGGLKEVNASLTRLDRKILHLETLLAKLTDRLSQQAHAGQACHVIVDQDNQDHLLAKNENQASAPPTPAAVLHHQQDESSKM